MKPMTLSANKETRMTSNTHGWRPCLLPAVFVVGLMAGGCARPEYSGFLAPYTGYQKVSKLSPDMEYVRPGVDWPTYRKVRIAQVTVIVEPRGGLRAVDPDELKRLTDHFEAKLVESFRRRCEVTSQAGPNVLDVKAVITRLRPTSRAADAAGFVIPGSFIFEAGYKAATNSNLALGEAGVEVEFADSRTGQRQYGFVGVHLGSSIEVQQVTRWGIAEKSLEKWAAFLVTRLQALQGSSSKA
jgi:hypothetical protein